LRTCSGARSRGAGPGRVLVIAWVLGAGESGKSTLFRQMKLIHVGRFTSEELDGYREVIVRNTIDSMRAIVAAMAKLNVPFEASTSAVRARPL
jgi:guanine nucleotide-binding protein G(i) subunit alpha